MRRKRRKGGPVAVITALVLGLASLIGLSVLYSAEGGSIDPTDPANYNVYALGNDTPARLYVHECSSPSCTTLDSRLDWIPIDPGAVSNQQVYWGDPSPTLYAVSNVEGTVTANADRWLALDASKKNPTTTHVQLSSARPCRH